TCALPIMVQKMIVRKCNKACKPVIIATQMMESMIDNLRPTRAETNDIANAVMDGADAVMLSAETAAGKFPVQAVVSMSKTIRTVEDMGDIYNKFYEIDPASSTALNDSVVSTACTLSNKTKAKAIVGMTTSGYTAFRISSHRPKANIFIFTSNRSVMTAMNLVWGVRCFYYDAMVSTDDTFSDIEKTLKKAGHIGEGDVFVSTASMPIHAKLRTNMLKVNIAE